MTNHPWVRARLSVLSIILMVSGCGSMFSYYSRNDSATFQTNGKITAMDSDTRTRTAGVFYIAPGSRVIGLRSKGEDSSEVLLILDATPNHKYRVDFEPSSGSEDAWSVTVKGKNPQANYRWCNQALSCKTNEPFDVCVRRHCPPE